MTALLIALNIIAGLFLIAVVLLQTGKGADMGAAFGGANPAVFGPSGSGNLLTRATAVCAAVFMGSSLMLAVLSARQSSVFDGTSEPAPIGAPEASSAPAGDVDSAGDVASPPATPPAASEPAAAASLEDALKQAAQQAVEGAAGSVAEAPTAAAEAPLATEPAAAPIPETPEAPSQQPASPPTEPAAGSPPAAP